MSSQTPKCVTIKVDSFEENVFFFFPQTCQLSSSAHGESGETVEKGNKPWASQHARRETVAKLLEHWNLVKQGPIYKSQFILGEPLGSTPLDIDEG